MALTALPIEIWTKILTYLRQPIPAPLSACPRTALRQPDLASVSRVSRELNEICLPLLYTEIVTDDALVLLNFDLTSERNRFSYTRRLFIEFKEKDTEPGYFELISRGRGAWGKLGSEHRLLAECEKEMHDLAVCWRKANEVTMGVGMPRLETVSICSIYGGEEATWRLYGDVYDANRDRLPSMPNPAASQAYFMLFLGSGNLQAVCSRDTLGPLSIPNIAAMPGSPYAQTVHLTSEPSALPFPIGCPIRYTFDSLAPSDDWCPIMSHLDQAFGHISDVRKRDLESGRFRAEKRHCVDIEIFCSTNHYRAGRDGPPLEVYGGRNHLDASVNPFPLTHEQQAAVAQGMGAGLQLFLRRDSGMADQVRWRPSGEQPVCACCGTGPPV